MGDGINGALRLATSASIGAVFGTLDYYLFFQQLINAIGTKTYTHSTISTFFTINHWIPI
jgi:hypothetical protein